MQTVSTVTGSGLRVKTYTAGSSAGQVTEYPESFTRSTVTKNLEKSDLVRNEIVSGWRKPSPYTLTSEEIDPGYWQFASENITWNSIDSRSYFGAPGLFKYSPYYRPPLTFGMMRSKDVSAKSLVMEAESVRAARNNVAARAFNLSSSLLEARSSLEGLSVLAKRLSDSYVGIRARSPKRVFRALGNPKGRQREFRELKRVLRRSAVDTPRGFSDALLTIEWGLTPIVDDMVGIAAYLSDDTKFYFVNGVGHSGKRSSVVLTPQKYPSPLGSQTSFRAVTKGELAWGYRTSLWFEIESEELRNLAKFGLSDLPTALWAIQPWSFMVDWVLPVSSYLKSLTATFGLQWKGGTTTYYSKMHVKCDYKDPNTSGEVSEWSGQPATGKRFHMDRYVHESEPLGLMPTIRDPFGTYQAVMSLALLGARIPKPSK